jgi:hypothetical protein
MPTLNHIEKTCSKCGVKLTYYTLFIPGRGEVCMKCYTEYAKEKELKP